jgi:hypothetical protein
LAAAWPKTPELSRGKWNRGHAEKNEWELRPGAPYTYENRAGNQQTGLAARERTKPWWAQRKAQAKNEAQGACGEPAPGGALLAQTIEGGENNLSDNLCLGAKPNPALGCSAVSQDGKTWAHESEAEDSNRSGKTQAELEKPTRTTWAEKEIETSLSKDSSR